jgi:flagellar biosynthesis GTPase FlhF
MINGTTVIKAKDTASAMEQVVKELGEDCVILSTKKVDDQISITASNSKNARNSVKKRYDKKKATYWIIRGKPVSTMKQQF